MSPTDESRDSGSKPVPPSFTPSHRVPRPGEEGQPRSAQSTAQPPASRPPVQPAQNPRGSNQPGSNRPRPEQPHSEQPRQQAGQPRTPRASEPRVQGAARTQGSLGQQENGGGAALGEEIARKPRRRAKRIIIWSLVTALILAIAWPVGLFFWANGKLHRVDVLSSKAATSGTTYLIAGSDSRAGTDPKSKITGARTDTIMVLHVPDSGPTALISIPRDSYAKIPGHKSNKINAAFTYGGAPLLIETVEGLTGYKVDHYVEVGFSGVKEIVDAVGGVKLCLDYNVNDKKSKLKWKKGCHEVGGAKALAFSRMRYSDPEGDIGRAKRQRQVIAAVATELKNPALLFKPTAQTALITAGAEAVTVDEDANLISLAKLALAFRDANSDGGITGTPPIKTLNYRPGNIGSAVLLDPDTTPQFFKDIAAGKLPAGEVGGITR